MHVHISYNVYGSVAQVMLFVICYRYWYLLFTKFLRMVVASRLPYKLEIMVDISRLPQYENRLL